MQQAMLSDFYKNNPEDKIWWVDRIEIIDGQIEPVDGEFLFSFDKKKIYNLFEDYPWKLSKQEKEIFNKENLYWADFFKDRK